MASQCCRATSRLVARGTTIGETTSPPAKLVLGPRTLSRERRRFRTRFVTRAEDVEIDFDAIVSKLSEKFESAENKPVVIGYGAAALLAFFFTEWLIHLPALDVLLGFPIQLLGVLIAPVLLIRYLVDKKDLYDDMEGTLDKVSTLLPGFKK